MHCNKWKCWKLMPLDFSCTSPLWVSQPSDWKTIELTSDEGKLGKWTPTKCRIVYLRTPISTCANDCDWLSCMCERPTLILNGVLLTDLMRWSRSSTSKVSGFMWLRCSNCFSRAWWSTVRPARRGIMKSIQLWTSHVKFFKKYLKKDLILDYIRAKLRPQDIRVVQ